MSKENDQALIIAKQKIEDAHTALIEASRGINKINSDSPEIRSQLYRQQQVLVSVTNIVWQVRLGMPTP